MEVNKSKSILILILLLIFFSSNSECYARGFLDFNVYPYLIDVENDSVITINAGAEVTSRLSYFSLTNFINQANSSALSEIDTFYSEQNIRWKISPDSPFDATWQSNFRSGERNDRHRIGVRWRLNDTASLSDFLKKINLSYAINLHAIQFDHESPNVWQLEHAFYLKLPQLSHNLYVSGFIDHTFNQELPPDVPKSPIVAEIQIGYKIAENLFAVSEYRINEYRRSGVNNLAVGLQYKLNW